MVEVDYGGGLVELGSSSTFFLGLLVSLVLCVWLWVLLWSRAGGGRGC